MTLVKNRRYYEKSLRSASLDRIGATKTLRLTLVRLLALVMLVPLAFAADLQRVESLATKLRCSCGCGEILQECSHPKCETKIGLKRELGDAIQRGQTDAQILEGMGTRHGAAVLLTPAFKGFNTMLWIVPIGVILFACVFFLLGRLRSKR